MTINGVQIDKLVSGDPSEARDCAAGYLVQLGYTLEGRSPARIHLKFSGRWFTSDPEEQTHHLYVSASPGTLHFEFTTGIIASYWTDRDQAMADERAEAATRAARRVLEGYRGSADEMHPCAYCGKKNPLGVACSVCGATPR